MAGNSGANIITPNWPVHWLNRAWKTLEHGVIKLLFSNFIIFVAVSVYRTIAI